MALSPTTASPCSDVEQVTGLGRDFFLTEIKGVATVDQFNRSNGSVQSSNVPVMAGVISIKAVDPHNAPVLTLDGRERSDIHLDPVKEYVFNPTLRHPDGPRISVTYTRLMNS